MSRHRIIAIYLPQYHPIPENDKWWGKGFTEWRNVVKAKPRFPGHYQPHLPADFGFYDLRVPEVMIEQAKMAKEHGIYGFCFYHYWFNGKLLLERPLEDMLKSKKPDFPFMICWANENWTRRWDGAEKEILIQQEYSEEDDINHIHYLMKFFKDPRYICINNKPVICIYRSTILPNIKRTIEIWRTEAAKENIELYICRFESFSQSKNEAFMPKELDAGIDFHPEFQERKEYIKYNRFFNYFRRKLDKFYRSMTGKFLFYRLVDYKKYFQFHSELPYLSYKWYPCIMPMWDNAARRKRNDFVAFTGSTPELFGIWLKSVMEKFIPYSKEENLIFINAWNEWAEGNHLEPDMKWGNRYLKEIQKLIYNE